MIGNQSTKIYSRKQIISWVESRTRYKFQQLKNGVFFLTVLSSLFPEDFQKQKFNSSPVSDYDFTTNINLMKKILNRRGLQMNLDVPSVVKAKNLFQLANWMRSLEEKSTSLTQDYYGGTNSNGKQDITPGKALKKQTETQNNWLKKTQSLSKSKREASQSKSQSNILKSKFPSCSSYKFDTINMHESKPKPMAISHIWEGEAIQIDEGTEDRAEEEMYERALEESIEGLKKICDKLKSEVQILQDEQYEVYRKRVQKAIFSKPISLEHT